MGSQEHPVNLAPTRSSRASRAAKLAVNSSTVEEPSSLEMLHHASRRSRRGRRRRPPGEHGVWARIRVENPALYRSTEAFSSLSSHFLGRISVYPECVFREGPPLALVDPPLFLLLLSPFLFVQPPRRWLPCQSTMMWGKEKKNNSK